MNKRDDRVSLVDMLIHGYDVVDIDILWDTIQNDLPPLIEQLQSIVGEET